MSAIVGVSANGVRVPLSRDGAARIARAVLRSERVSHAMLSITFVSNAGIRALNRKHLTSAELAAIDSLNRDFMERARPVMKIFYPTVVAAAKTFEFHDLTGCLNSFAAPAFADECHYLDAATPTIASAIADVIAPAVTEAAKRSAGTTAGRAPAR